MEMADALCITKADHGNEQAARRAKLDYQSALHLFPSPPSGQTVPVLLTSAVAGTGVAEVWHTIETYAAATRASGYFAQRRQQQQLQWLHQSVAQALEARFYANPAVRERLPAVQAAVAAGTLTPWAAAEELLGQ
jgi:LAO/AO transport system kinase